MAKRLIMSADLIHLLFGDVSHVTKFSQNDKIPLCCIVHVVYFLYAIMHVFGKKNENVLIGKHCLKPF